MSTQPIELTDIPPIQLARRARYLMCPPHFYDVNYVINPWMEGNLHRSSRERAELQWRNLYRALTRLIDVELIAPQSGLPDMVFTANAGLERSGTVVLSRFYHQERQSEEQCFRQWFQEAGYTVVELPTDVPFEGEGDALFSIDGSRLWVGYGRRTARESHRFLARALRVEVISLHLTDPRFYHLDTCFAPLDDGYVMYYPDAFDAASLEKIEEYYPLEKRILVSEEDAIRFACNAIHVDGTVVLNCVSRELTGRLESAGFRVVQIDLSEFIKAGGAAKCLVMNLATEKISLNL
ncbi:dimethylarginine dimethylaminohydrolase family protein [Edaphobacter flagellatus]|uniref:dimethylarginine dimethylaminohydrolase family protein n=1 Tax=Edaphobacter flagellatus TaxID=1933044 RepID=UPI0021B4313D|nr:arginine deiminase-related protein [Edaphobacter flagellatus]